MPKFYGIVGYAEMQETRPGVWTEVLMERRYQGDVIRNTRRWEAGEHLNDNLRINNMISIVSDPWLDENGYKIRYAQWGGTFWKITNVEYARPRILLTMGEVYIKSVVVPISASAASSEVCGDPGYPGPKRN